MPSAHPESVCPWPRKTPAPSLVQLDDEDEDLACLHEGSARTQGRMLDKEHPWECRAFAHAVRDAKSQGRLGHRKRPALPVGWELGGELQA